jgi:3-oxoacyl-[acyl-carrier-protein] synthase III
METTENSAGNTPSFFERPGVRVIQVPVGKGVPLGIEQVTNSRVGIGGAYGSWGESYDNASLPLLIEERLGEQLSIEERMNLSELGFDRRHHIPELSEREHLEVELEVGTQFLRAACQANGWDPSEVEGVVVGVSGPASNNYLEEIAARAGIPAQALKVVIHKACDGSVGSLNLALNPNLGASMGGLNNVAEELRGKKVLVGGIEGLSRFMRYTRDKNALQLFGNGAGIIGIVPGESLKFLVGKTREVFDEEGLLKVRMCYPHSKEKLTGHSLIEVSAPGNNYLRVAGLMHEPHGESPVEMAGLMGMVKLFVRSGVDVVKDVYGAYQAKMSGLGTPDRLPAVAIVHHANLKINKLIDKHLQREGIRLNMPWLLSEFGNVSAASNMIAFMRQLPSLRPGEHVLFDGFGAGTYYDALAVEMGG